MKQSKMRERHVHGTCAKPRRVEPLPHARWAADRVAVAGDRKRRTQGVVLVALDLNPSSSTALDWVLGLANRLSASTVLLHVVEPAYGRWFVDSSRRESYAANANHAALQKLKAMIPPQPDGWPPVTCIVRNGLPEYEILRAAEILRADLIVLGSRPRNPLHQLIFGSTAHDLIDCAPCPVLVLSHGAGAPRWQ